MSSKPAVSSQIVMQHLRRICLALSLAGAFAASAAPHDRAYWKAITDSNFKVPAGTSAAALMNEVTELYASPDPLLRDAYAFEITAVWVYRDKVLGPDELRPLMARLLANLSRDLERRGDVPVLRRSFSALALSTIAARESVDPFLTTAEFDDFLTRTIAYLRAEHDLRGFDPKVGWIHATAHTADVLKFLARSPKLRASQQRPILDALSARLSTAGVAFTHDEDERMARVAISLIARPDFDLAGFRDWLAHFGIPQHADQEAILIRRGNTKHFLESLLTLEMLDDRLTGSAPANEARGAVLEALRNM